MNVTYDARTDTLTVILKEGVRVAESDEDRLGVILDYDDQGNNRTDVRISTSPEPRIRTGPVAGHA